MLKDFKLLLKILLRFILPYLGFVFLYQLYLNQYVNKVIDPFSRWVATQVVWLQNQLGYNTLLVDAVKYNGVYFWVENQYLSRMVEGCNALSIMILFLAFIFAFYRGFKTLLFGLIGVVIIHIINVIRIVGLNIVILQYNDYSKAFHDYIFPAIIYGTIVVLWIIWIKCFVFRDVKDENI